MSQHRYYMADFREAKYPYWTYSGFHGDLFDYISDKKWYGLYMNDYCSEWTTLDEDMIAMSKEFPHVVINILHSSGMFNMECLYYCNGEKQSGKVEMTPPECTIGKPKKRTISRRYNNTI